MKLFRPVSIPGVLSYFQPAIILIGFQALTNLFLVLLEFNKTTFLTCPMALTLALASPLLCQHSNFQNHSIRLLRYILQTFLEPSRRSCYMSQGAHLAPHKNRNAHVLHRQL